MRYQIADGIVDFIHLCWVTFLLAPLGAFTMGGGTLFGPLRTLGPDGSMALPMALLGMLPMVAVAHRWRRPYLACRAGSALWFAYLCLLCVRARPVSTGAIYGIVAAGALALLAAAWRADWSGRGA